MRIDYTLVTLIVLISFSPVVLGQESEPDGLCEELKVFAPFIGTWEIDGNWLSGEPIWARSNYTVGMKGNFVEARTWTKDDDGNVFQRYLTIWRWDNEAKQVVSHGFTFDGTYTEIETLPTMVEGKATLTSSWTNNGIDIKQVVQQSSDDQYTWKVYVVGSEGEQPIMDGVWERVIDADDAAGDPTEPVKPAEQIEAVGTAGTVSAIETDDK